MREIGGSRTRQRKGTERKKKKKGKKEINKEHARDPNANRSNKVNPIKFLLIIVWLYITPPHSTKTSRERKKSAR